MIAAARMSSAQNGQRFKRPRERPTAHIRLTRRQPVLGSWPRARYGDTDRANEAVGSPAGRNRDGTPLESYPSSSPAVTLSRRDGIRAGRGSCVGSAMMNEVV